MKVSELIDLLKAHDQDADVVRTGYEGGFADIEELIPVTLVCDVNEEWYYGPHETVNHATDKELEEWKHHRRKSALVIL